MFKKLLNCKSPTFFITCQSVVKHLPNCSKIEIECCQSIVKRCQSVVKLLPNCSKKKNKILKISALQALLLNS